MKKKIQEALAELEAEKDIKILYAVESGSRAWGFASENSDWDVRFIYVHRKNWYLSIDRRKDNVNRMLPDDLDLSGWEIRKALGLFRKSNPPMLEWLRSPIIYAESFSTAEKLRKLSDSYFNPRSCLYHYLSMARGNYKDYLQGETVKLKKYFYVLRPIIACDWIADKKEMAPMEFQTLVDDQIKDPELKGEIEQLIQRKKEGEELSKGPQIPIINKYVESRIDYHTEMLKDFDWRLVPDTEKLNELFRETLVEAWK